jgi:hypothetical protein
LDRIACQSISAPNPTNATKIAPVPFLGKVNFFPQKLYRLVLS